MLAVSTASAGAVGAGRVDGISDQSLPAWDGSFQSSPLSSLLASSLAAAPPSQITIARYVVQWDVESEPTHGGAPAGDYRERFEAWLADVGAVGLTPVVALTSYTGDRPRSLSEYRLALSALLQDAQAQGGAIPWIEPWNEPNGQGREPPLVAAELADAAAEVCDQLESCSVIAGDVQDSDGAAAYERAYQAGLTFTPAAWGVHPYVAVKRHDDANLLAWRASLPAGAPVWFTEVGAYYCEAGEVSGLARQAGDAEYVTRLIAAVEPVHVFYYGLLYADREAAPCTAGGGDDVELFDADGAPRPAARVLLGEAIDGAALRFAPDRDGLTP